MTRHIKPILVVVFGLLMILSAALLVRHRKSELASLSKPVERPLLIQVKNVTQGRLPIIEHYLGTILPVMETKLSAQTTGTLTKIRKEIGDTFQAGDSIAEIDHRLLTYQKQSLQAELAGAEENYAVKKTILGRHQQLYEKNVVSKEALDKARLEFELARSQLAQVKQQLASASVSLSYSHIRPLDNGVVTQRHKEIGDLVGSGSPVFTVEDPSKGYKIFVSIPLETIARLTVGAKVRLQHGIHYTDAAVFKIHPSITNGSLATVEIRVADRPFGLPSYSRIGVDLYLEIPEGWIVSADCILELEIGAWVFPVQENRIGRPVAIQILGTGQGQAVVKGDLQPKLSLAAGPESLLLHLSENKKVITDLGGMP